MIVKAREILTYFESEPLVVAELLFDLVKDVVQTRRKGRAVQPSGTTAVGSKKRGRPAGAKNKSGGDSNDGALGAVESADAEE